MLAVSGSYRYVARPGDILASPSSSVEATIESLSALQAAMDATLLKLNVSEAPSYLQCMLISATSAKLTHALHHSATLAAATTQHHVTEQDTSSIVTLCADIGSRSQLIDVRMRTLRPHLQRLGLMILVRKDLRASYEAVIEFLGGILTNLPEELRAEARSMIADVMHSATATMCDYGL